MKTTVYSLLLEMHNEGNEVRLFPSKAAMDAESERIMREAVAEHGDSLFERERDAAKELLDLLEAGDLEAAWAFFAYDDNPLRPEDYYSITEHTLEIEEAAQ